MNYCLPVWGGATETLLQPIIKIQKKAIRLCTQSRYNAHTTTLFGRIKSLKFKDLYQLRCSEVGIDVAKDRTSPGMAQCFKVLHNDTMMQRTRGENSVLPRLFVPVPTTDAMARLPSVTIPRIWRDLDDKYKLFGKLALKEDYKFYTFEDYNNWTCLKKKCYSCIEAIPPKPSSLDQTAS